MKLKLTILALMCAAVVGCQKSNTAPQPDSYSMGNATLNVTSVNFATPTTRAEEEVVNEVLTESTDAEGNPVLILPERLNIDTDKAMIDIEGSYIIPDAVTGTQLPDGAKAEVEFEPMTIAKYKEEARYLFASEYKFKLTYGDPTVEGLDTPCYAGESQVQIIARKSIEAPISLKLCNSIVNKVTTSEKFNNYYKLDECHFFISTSRGTKREFNIASGATVAEPVSESVLFFVEAGTTLTLSGTAVKSNGVEVEFNGTMGTTDAAKIYTIAIDADDVGSSTIKVDFDDTITSFETVEVPSADLRPSITE